MAYLDWIDDKDLKQAVTQILEQAVAAKKEAKEDFSKNVTDPFSALFEIAGFEVSHDQWIVNEQIRKAQKTLQNHIGEFHQNILGCANGWTNMKTGSVFDLINRDRKILAELKNKYNTVSGGKLSTVYDDLENLVSPKSSMYKGYKGYYVVVIPKKPTRYDIPFTPSDKEVGKKRRVNENIREIDGASFYELVTGHKDALEDLFSILPQVILDCSKGKYKIKDKEKLKAFFDLAYHKK